MLNSPVKYLISLIILVSCELSLANAPKVGRTAAAKYFQQNSDQSTPPARYTASESEPMGDRYMTFGVSTFTKSDVYSWGNVNKQTDVGKWGLDMNYRLSQYNNLLDYSLRVNYTEYEPLGQKANKISFMYAATLPDAGSRFPLYFGAALGAGVFLTQISNESPVTADYSLYAGIRLFDVVETTGFYIEGGLKNHLQLTSDGQLNGTYVSAGAVFTF